MRFGRLNPAIVVLGLVVIVSTPAMASAADPDWKAVEQALGKSGQIQPGDVFRIGMPRTDLAVTVRGVPVKAGFALGSYAAFKQVGDQAMVMGDLVLLDQEVPAVMSGLLSRGLDVTAVHNHLNEMAPHVMYMHYEGHGDALQLAKALRQALSASGTPLGGAGAASPGAAGPGLDTKQIEQVLGRSGRDIGGGVFQVTAPRPGAITARGGWPEARRCGGSPRTEPARIGSFPPAQPAFSSKRKRVSVSYPPIRSGWSLNAIAPPRTTFRGSSSDTTASGARSMPSSRNSS